MLQALDRFLSALTALPIASISFLLIATTGFVDHLTGYELSFSIFYLIPVALGSWYGGRALAAGTCIASAIVWLAVAYTAGHEYRHAVIPAWNAAVRLGFFLVVSHLLRGLRAALKRQALLAQQDGLTGILNAQLRAAPSGTLPSRGAARAPHGARISRRRRFQGSERPSRSRRR